MDLVHRNQEPYVFLCGWAGYGPLYWVHLESRFTQESGDQIFQIFFTQSQEEYTHGFSYTWLAIKGEDTPSLPPPPWDDGEEEIYCLLHQFNSYLDSKICHRGKKTGGV